MLTGPVLELTLAAETLKLLSVCASEPCVCILWSLILNAPRGKEPVELEGSAEAVGHLPLAKEPPEAVDTFLLSWSLGGQTLLSNFVSNVTSNLPSSRPLG